MSGEREARQAALAHQLPDPGPGRRWELFDEPDRYAPDDTRQGADLLSSRSRNALGYVANTHLGWTVHVASRRKGAPYAFVDGVFPTSNSAAQALLDALARR